MVIAMLLGMDKSFNKGEKTMKSVIKLTDIPDGLLPVINASDESEAHIYLNGRAVSEIFIFKNQYRISTDKGQFRYPLDTDVTIEIY